jgi:ATP synthase protein I
MSDNTNGLNPSNEPNRREEGALWSIFGYLLSGLLVWGGIGYGLDHLLNRGIFTLIGLLLGMGSSLYLVWMRFGRK